MEKEIESYLRKRVASAGGLCWKWVSPGRVGVPDRIVLFPSAVICFVELKDKGKTERASQVVVQRMIRNLGFQVFSSVDSVEKCNDVINWCKTELIKRGGGTCGI